MTECFPREQGKLSSASTEGKGAKKSLSDMPMVFVLLFFNKEIETRVGDPTTSEKSSEWVLEALRLSVPSTHSSKFSSIRQDGCCSRAK